MSGRSLLVCCAVLVALAAAVTAALAAGVGPGVQCTHPSNCSDPYSSCHNNRCVCLSNYEFNGTMCAMELNVNCDTRYRCNRAGAECINALCLCKQNYTMSRDNRSCVPVAGRPPSGAPFPPPAHGQPWPVPGAPPSSPGAPPYSPGASPYSPGASPYSPGAPPPSPGASPYSPGASPYSPGASPSSPGASPHSPGASPFSPGAPPPPANNYPSAPGVSRSALGQFCRSDSNCSAPHSVCTRGVCACADGYTQANGSCVHRAARVYDPCVYNDSCLGVPNTTCHNGLCVCLLNYFPSSSRRSCEHLPCRAGSCSYVGYAACTSNMNTQYCSCMGQDFIVDGDKCYKEIGTVGAKCDEKKSEKCYLSGDGLHQHVECKKGKCQCKKNYKADKRNKRCIAGASAAAASALLLSVAAAFAFRA